MDGGERAKPVTIISPIRRWWSWWLHATWPLANRTARVKRPLVQLSFIHFAHWSVLSRMPPGVPRRQSKRLSHPYLLFQSNFNDDLGAYVDAFSLVVPWRMRGMFHGVFHFPGPRPVDRFLRFVSGNTTDTPYYYCAYPGASSTMIADALKLDGAYRRFAARARDLDDEAFAERFAEFLVKNQGLL
jgi:hypothetical protein